jgi:hypothetical protein
MKNSKEKAKELVDNFYSKISGLPINFVSKMITMPNGDSYFELAKQCALIACDEVIEYLTTSSDVMISVNAFEFWQQVKTEINNI